MRRAPEDTIAVFQLLFGYLSFFFIVSPYLSVAPEFFQHNRLNNISSKHFERTGQPKLKTHVQYFFLTVLLYSLKAMCWPSK